MNPGEGGMHEAQISDRGLQPGCPALLAPMMSLLPGIDRITQ